MEKDTWTLSIRCLSGNQTYTCLIEDRKYQFEGYFQLTRDKHIPKIKLTFKNALDEDAIIKFSPAKKYEILEVTINGEIFRIVQERQKVPTAEEIFKLMDKFEL